MDSILELFSQEKEVQQLLQANLITKSIAKGTILQHWGEIYCNVYFVKKGLLRSYSIDAKDKEHIYMFAPEGWIISELENYLNHGTNNLYIDCLENSEVEILQVKDLPEGFMMNHGFNREANKRFIKRIAVLQHRIIMLMSASALERYTEFLDTYPNIVQRVPQKMIASYLGVTPEALSKIRGQIAKPK
jgi:CRP-like cAMP-binding protein